MQLPYTEPLTVREPGERVVPEPPRRGEPGGEPCGLCSGQATPPVWHDEHFSLHPPVQGSLAGAVWLASREHVDSFSDLSPEAAPRSARWPPASSERSWRSATSAGCTSTAGATVVPTSTCGSCRAHSGCSRRRE